MANWISGNEGCLRKFSKYVNLIRMALTLWSYSSYGHSSSIVWYPNYSYLITFLSNNERGYLKIML